jgi:uncharacterized protein (DUF983 family)
MTKANPSSLKKAWRYFSRSARLRCPVCGVSPLFRPVAQIRSGLDWFEPLPGCPRCDYVYEQEPGYFMLALWVFDYGAAALFGIGLALILSNSFELSTGQLLLLTLVPTLLLALLAVRHAKAFYLAIDHYFFHQDEPQDCGSRLI